MTLKLTYFSVRKAMLINFISLEINIFQDITDCN